MCPDADISEHPPAQAWQPRLAIGRRLIPGLVAFVVLAAMVEVYGWRSKPITLPSVVRISPITTYPGDEREPSLSPDGRQVAFSWEGEKGGTRHIYVTSLGEQHPLRLTSEPADDAYPAWSPDGKHIAFMRRRAGTRADLIIVPAIGGRERKLREIRLGAWITSRTLAWTPDAKWLCFTDEVGTSGHHVLFLLSPDSDAVQRLSPEEDNGIGDSSPAFSPDGRWLAFARFEHPNNSNLLIQRLSPDLTHKRYTDCSQGRRSEPESSSLESGWKESRLSRQIADYGGGDRTAGAFFLCFGFRFQRTDHSGVKPATSGMSAE